jgi:hypothetical protein
LAAGNVQAVFELGDLGAHGAQVLRDQRDAVGFLDAQFLGVADADAAAGEGRDGRQHRQLVDELGGQRAADFRRAKAFLRAEICTVPTSSAFFSSR